MIDARSPRPSGEEGVLVVSPFAQWEWRDHQQRKQEEWDKH